MEVAKGADTSGDWLVFVSHSGTDTWVARQIARGITDCGATPFLDEAAINVGADFEHDILAFLKKAHELVVLLTPWALDRPYVWAELGAAWYYSRVFTLSARLLADRSLFWVASRRAM